MSEWTLVFLVPFRLFIASIFVTCYVIGGRKGKWVRRFLGPALWGLGLVLLSIYTRTFEWLLLFIPPTYMGALTLGYGGDSFWKKFLRRTLYGFALGACGVFAGWVTGHIFLGFVQFFLALVINPLLGIPSKESAVSEEAEIAFLSTGLVPFMV